MRRGWTASTGAYPNRVKSQFLTGSRNINDEMEEEYDYLADHFNRGPRIGFYFVNRGGDDGPDFARFDCLGHIA